MARVTTAAKPSSAPVEAQIAAFLAKYDPAVVKEAKAARRALRKAMPTAHELVYDNYNALAIGYAPGDRPKDVILSIALYPRWVTLFFLQGATLADPDGLLEGKGSTVRSIRLERARDLEKAPVVALMERARASARAPLPASGRGATLIKSVSTKQRPRRPS